MAVPTPRGDRAVLREISEVIEAAVLPVPDEKRREEVKALLILKQGVNQEQCPPSLIIEHCSSRLAKFKVPRHIGYVHDFTRTSSNKIAKQQITDQGTDPRLNTYDRVDGVWR